MIAVDTNVLVRFLAGDDPHQSQLARRVIADASSQDPLFVGSVALVETWWVMRQVYRASADQMLDAIRRLSIDDALVMQDRKALTSALAAVAEGADFADALIAAVARTHGCRETLTFDRKAAARPGMTLLEDLDKT